MHTSEISQCKKKKKVIISIKENGRIALRLNLKIFIKINIGKTDISPKIPIQTLNFLKKYWEITNIK